MNSLKWMVVLGIVVLVVVGMTALDKYDERSCRQDLQVIERTPNPDDDDTIVNRSVLYVFGCDGFLPW